MTDVKLKFNRNVEDLEDIQRCLTNLYRTIEGTQPLDRNFGLKADFLDKPLPVVQNLITLEIIKKTAIYEPRIKVSSVTFETSEETDTVLAIIHLVKNERM